MAFEQPVFVEVAGELADPSAQVLKCVEALDPQWARRERRCRRIQERDASELLVGDRSSTREPGTDTSRAPPVGGASFPAKGVVGRRGGPGGSSVGEGSSVQDR